MHWRHFCLDKTGCLLNFFWLILAKIIFLAPLKKKKCLAVLAKKVFGQLWQKTYSGNFGKKTFGQLWLNTLWDK